MQMTSTLGEGGRDTLPKKRKAIKSLRVLLDKWQEPDHFVDAIHLVTLPVADHVEEVAVGEEVDARRVGEGEGDEAVVGHHQGRQETVEDSPQLLTWRKGKISTICALSYKCAGLG